MKRQDTPAVKWLTDKPYPEFREGLNDLMAALYNRDSEALGKIRNKLLKYHEPQRNINYDKKKT